MSVEVTHRWSLPSTDAYSGLAFWPFDGSPIQAVIIAVYVLGGVKNIIQGTDEHGDEEKPAVSDILSG